MSNSFKEVTLHALVELGKYKKPSKITLFAAKVLCLLVNAFREDKVTQFEAFD
jgi:hypothetical protein